MKRLLFLILLSINLKIFAQVIINSSTFLTVTENTILYDSGLIINSGNFINNGSTIIAGNLLNNSSFISGALSQITFSGTVQQTLESTSGPLTFNIAEINNPLGLCLHSDIYINNSFIFSAGNVITYNPLILPHVLNTLFFNSTSSPPVELQTNYILGKSTMISRFIGTNSMSFLGCFIDTGSDNLGNIEITRINGIDGVITAQNTSIASHWLIYSDNEPINGRGMQFSWFSDFDYLTNVSAAQVKKSEIPFNIWYSVGNVQDVSALNPREISVNTNQFSKWTVADTEIPLPVTWFDFRGLWLDNASHLTWSTATEINSDYFVIQRSFNAVDFDSLDLMPATGFSVSINTYNYIDNTGSVDDYNYVYYRIKNVDIDGKFTYSNTIALTIADNKENISIYPNPATNILFINFSLKSNSEIKIRLVNEMGIEVKNQIIIYEPVSSFSINISRLCSGLYFLIIEQNGIVIKTESIIKEG